MSRQYINLSGEQLKQAVEDNKGNSKVLKDILAELQFRTTRQMKALRAVVEDMLSGAKTTSTDTKTHTSSSTTGIAPQSPKPEPAQESLFKDLVTPPPKASKPAEPVSEPKTASGSKSAGAKKTEEEPPRERRMGKMRKPGKLDDVPSKRVFELKTVFKLELKKDASTVDRYEACLKALVAEMRKQKTAYKQVVLEDGTHMQLDGKEHGYQFPYNEDAELFEGAAVVVIIGGSQSEGRIVSFLGNKIVISLKDDFGPRIAACIVKIDNTAMLEALRARLEKIIKGEAASFNVRLAEAVITNTGDELAPAFVSADYLKGLNAYQKEAIAKIVANEVFYLWGPPGTGKTMTLSALCHALIDGQKRILLCSNTNQAVDQVLLKLCKLFKKQNHLALTEGQILRVGQIAHTELKNDWSSHITLEGIVERKSQLLIERKGVLEIQLDRINAQVSRATELMKMFKVLDGLNVDKSQATASFQKVQAEYGSLTEKKKTLEDKQKTLVEERQNIQNAGTIRRVFMRSLDVVEKDIRDTGTAFLSKERELIACGEKLVGFRGRTNEIDNAISLEKQKVAGVDRKQVEQQLEQAEVQKRPISEEISDINKQLEDIRKSILDRALIVGATVTKAYLSPQMFSSFDVVIVDEASMVMLPALFNAAGLAKEKVVISGDFRQLAPIVQTEQKVIHDTIGGDVFRACQIDKKMHKEQTCKRVAMLKEQYRMDDQICQLISHRMYKGALLTASERESTKRQPPAPFNTPLTIVDTSSIWPFVNRDQFKSRYNLMNALAIRNLCSFFESCDHLTEIKNNGERTNRVGVCTPYAAQSKVLQRVFEGSRLKETVEAGTVHRYQGDEKQVMIIDIPDSHGEQRAGIFLDADHHDDSGAMLFNVAVSRAQHNLIVFANLAYLDKKLPSHAILRDILSEMQGRGTVVDVLDVLAMYPVMEDLRRLGRPFNLSVDAEKFGLFDQNSFDQVCAVDFERAKKSIAVYSGFVTEQRVATYESVFRQKRAEGVMIRCITRPPKSNGSIPVEQGKAALDGLERMGCLVDTRGEIHEKVVIIDDEILWHGSLNALSHTNRTDEVMTRLEGKAICLQMSAFLALDRSVKADNADGISSKAENPRCPMCDSRSSYRKGKYGPYWDCEDCDWKENYDKPVRKKSASTGQSNVPPPACDKCGKPMKVRAGRFGDFYGCTGYPDCKNITKMA
ncbi:AAA domain-containing protein [Citrifermentans bremense]|uniref:AAA domain-containing protein n=1 Tax=Citrifermentans bremense TaxID=60035 RepID=UPI000A04B05E|nr:AAA domain-containing protein [Citrifermentans bremense]